MSFPEKVRQNVLLKCKRHCCLCGKYAGIKMELHHIKQQSHGGADTEDNCIPLCFDCHAEVRSYNPEHPKGLKYTEKELKARRDEIYNRMSNALPHNQLEDSDIFKLNAVMNNYGSLLEKLISNDPCSCRIENSTLDEVEHFFTSLQKYQYNFINKDLDFEKLTLIDNLIHWHNIISDDCYFHCIDNNSARCFNPETVNSYRPTMLQLRNSIRTSYCKFRQYVS